MIRLSLPQLFGKYGKLFEEWAYKMPVINQERPQSIEFLRRMMVYLCITDTRITIKT